MHNVNNKEHRQLLNKNPLFGQKNNCIRSKKRGSTLLEILVSVAVFTTGVVALTSNINTSIDDHRNADFHSEAVIATNDLVKRIRNNINGFNALNYNLTDTSIASLASTAPTNCTANCTTAALASLDLFEWANSYSDTLSNANVQIGIDASSTEHLRIGFLIPTATAMTMTNCYSQSSKDSHCYASVEKICEVASSMSGFCN